MQKVPFFNNKNIINEQAHKETKNKAEEMKLILEGEYVGMYEVDAGTFMQLQEEKKLDRYAVESIDETARYYVKLKHTNNTLFPEHNTI